MQEWTKYDLEIRTTWHPIGTSRWFGAVRFEQRVNGQATGLNFTVSRRRYWLIRMLRAAVQWKLPLAGRLYGGIVVKYRWIWIGKRGQA